MILLIDHFDSFVHNLARYFEQLGCPTHVVRADAIDAGLVEEKKPQALVLSPGPCTPRESPVSEELVNRYAEKLPILGVCLGHQIIVSAFGGSIVRSDIPMHGRASAVFHDQDPIFTNVPSPFTAGRYHSLVADASKIPDCLVPIAQTSTDEVMAVRHRRLPVYGVQFHPESILTDHGYLLLQNFLTISKSKTVARAGDCTV